MKIAVWHNLHSGGGKRALWNHVAGLIQRGHQVESWCPDSADKNYLPLSRLCREHVLPLAPSPFKKAPPLLGWMADYQQMKTRLTAMRAHCAACADEINAGGFDLFFGNTCANLAVAPIARFVKLPKVLYLQEPNRRLYETLEETPFAGPAVSGDTVVPSLAKLTLHSVKFQYRPLLVREEKDNAAFYDRILVNSFFSRESVLRAYGLDSEVCYLGIDTDFFHPTNEPVENYIVGLGAVDIQKGVTRAVEALGLVPAALRPKLIWVGNNANKNYVAGLMARAKILGVDFEVRVMLKDDELISLLSRATAMLYTSLLEPFGLAPLEANACGTPVIAVAEGGVRESIVDGENGVLVSSASPKKLATAIRNFLENPARARELRAKARPAVVARFGLAASNDTLEQALLDVQASARRKI